MHGQQTSRAARLPLSHPFRRVSARLRHARQRGTVEARERSRRSHLSELTPHVQILVPEAVPSAANGVLRVLHAARHRIDDSCADPLHHLFDFVHQKNTDEFNSFLCRKYVLHCTVHYSMYEYIINNSKSVDCVGRSNVR